MFGLLFVELGRKGALVGLKSTSSLQENTAGLDSMVGNVHSCSLLAEASTVLTQPITFLLITVSLRKQL